MVNLYVFWKLVADPPAPWTRLTRSNQYIRFSDTLANHWTNTGATTHSHTISSYSCGNPTTTSVLNSSGTLLTTHTHDQPSSWSISTGNNAPPGYGLDIIYMDLTSWESPTYRYFPEGAVVLSDGALTDAGNITRFTAADGKYIYHSTPETTTGSTGTHNHSMSGTLAATSAGGTYKACGAGGSGTGNSSHSHTISMTSTSTYQEPAYVATRMYEMLRDTTHVVSGIVIFVDGTPGDRWELITSWSGKNLKSANSDPTTGGSDTHSHTGSGTSSSGPEGWCGGSGTSAVISHHNHSISVSSNNGSNIPYSKMVIPAKLLETMYPVKNSSQPQIIGLSAW